MILRETDFNSKTFQTYIPGFPYLTLNKQLIITGCGTKQQSSEHNDLMWRAPHYNYCLLYQITTVLVKEEP